MSEISDAVQIIRVAYDGIEIILKLGSGTLDLMKQAVKLITGILEHEKTMGKTNLKGLLEKGGDIQIISFADEDLKKFKKLAKKYGILYSVMPDAKRNDGITEVMYHSEASPRMHMMSQKLQNSRLYNLDEYLKDGNKEQLNQLLDFLEKERMGNRNLHTEETFFTEHALDGLIHKVGMYAIEKQSVSVEAVQTDFKVEEQQAKDILEKLQKIGVLDKAENDNRYTVAMDREAFEKRIGKYQELTDRMKQIAASKNTDLIDITISKILIFSENDRAVKTRVPGLYGNNVGYLWINKQDICEIHNGKTMLTYLDKNKDYKIYSEDNRVLYTVRGEELFSKHYDHVEKSVRKRYEQAKVEPSKVSTQTRRR